MTDLKYICDITKIRRVDFGLLSLMFRPSDADGSNPCISSSRPFLDEMHEITDEMYEISSNLNLAQENITNYNLCLIYLLITKYFYNNGA